MNRTFDIKCVTHHQVGWCVEEVQGGGGAPQCIPATGAVGWSITPGAILGIFANVSFAQICNEITLTFEIQPDFTGALTIPSNGAVVGMVSGPVAISTIPIHYYGAFNITGSTGAGAVSMSTLGQLRLFFDSSFSFTFPFTTGSTIQCSVKFYV
jgi:hypothetical protein